MRLFVSAKGRSSDFGISKELEDFVEINSALVERGHVIIVLPNSTLVSELIKSSGCFVLNYGGSGFAKCEKLLDSVKLGNAESWFECEVLHSYGFDKFVLFVGLMVHKG